MSDVLVLSYHAVSNSWPAALSVGPDDLESQLRLLARRGYEGIRFADAALCRRERPVVAVTFDDAYRSVLVLARPILEQLGFPGTVFAASDFVSAGRAMTWPGIDRWLGGEHERELLPLSWDELRDLADEGWEVGSHTCSHPYLTRLDDSALDRELVESRALIEAQLGRPCTSIAYPYGDHDERVLHAAARAGYRAGCTVPRRLTKPRPLAWPRVGVYNGNGNAAFRFKISPAGRRLRQSRLWPLVDGSFRATRNAVRGRRRP